MVCEQETIVEAGHTGDAWVKYVAKSDHSVDNSKLKKN